MVPYGTVYLDKYFETVARPLGIPICTSNRDLSVAFSTSNRALTSKIPPYYRGPNGYVTFLILNLRLIKKWVVLTKMAHISEINKAFPNNTPLI